ncbi:hypothetical protein GTA62_04785 [Roseobacter sp. HKCCD9010]|uniref:hypothetical protein n=1 Tax=unclassified Roseobacter TaxID=196798 RepID=UPI001491FDFF|nr:MULTISPECIES: hypothetical protein [unclassified Roseobacter]MBF9048812.1 hypothetical protein [Rhodobacterales bacterium HKCCD4356]NNV37236.1 hypothetical protein [Roseobacter sp. HKCCD9054]NNV92577.1 hypothetical protein [Roseobacter sp. HKCCD8914]NNX37430.1 hypothetical protein [Roseobacter sp. HKCCD5941-2]NOA65258.1 hypothetical protein [Roseobacter sp. HKCCD8628]NOB33376.1 hypothetical protein [Roseobacter sp. HKCCD8421]NOB54740.1 hypothetical protein [Roseobacter sp. HKCCD8420]NOB7
MAPVFRRVVLQDDTLALYRAEVSDETARGLTAGPRALHLLYLGADRGGWSAPPDELEYAASWKARGVYLLSDPFEVQNLTALKDAVPLKGQNKNRGFAWVDDPGGTPQAVLMPMTWTGEETGRVAETTEIAFLNVALTMQQGVEVVFDFGEAPKADLKVGQSGTARIFLNRAKTIGPEPTEETVQMPLAPDDAGLGLIRYRADWQARAFFRLFEDNEFNTDPAWGGEIRFFLKTTGRKTPQQLVFPLFTAPEQGVSYPLDVRMDPLAPNDANRTVFDLRDEGGALALLTSRFLRTTGGDEVQLTPQPGVGFYLGRRPGPTSSGGANSYLATKGPFLLDLLGKADAQLMCGLSAQEYVTVADGDLVDLTPNQAALADLGDKERGLVALADQGDAPLLEPAFTTSWLSIRPRPTRQADAVEPYYFSQSQQGTNFDKNALAGTTYAGATASRITHLGAAAVAGVGGGAISFPVAPFGGVFPPDSDIEGWPNKDVPGEDFQTLEGGALAPFRFGSLSLAGPATGPIVCNADGTPLVGGRSSTQRGVLLEIGSGIAAARDEPAPPQGGWARLVLGESDKGELAFKQTGAGVVDPTLAQALLNPQAFIVMNDWDRFSDFDSAISVQGIDVNLSPAEGQADPRQTILVFKYADTETLEDLVARVDAWDRPEYFVGDAGAVTHARELLLGAIAEAKAQKDTPGQPFRYFLETILVSKEWTGFLTFNAPIDGRQMPPDYQMILGGIDGQLMAHHFGVETNRLTLDDDGRPVIQGTAFAGVFFYLEPSGRPEPEEAYGYRTTKLIIEIRNATIQQFASEVAVTLNELFERPVSGQGGNPSEPNTIRMEGDYQVVEGVGRVIFQAALSRSFIFQIAESDIRVLRRFMLRGAGLSPISAASNELRDAEEVTIAARFSMDGELAFDKAPFPSNPGQAPLDLFSYGVTIEEQKRGLPISGLSIDLEFDLGPTGRTDLRLKPNFANIIAVDNPDLRRPEGLVSGLPMRLTGFLSGQAALDTIKRTGKIVNIPDLIPDQSVGEGDDSADLNQIPVLDATTPTPSFALAFELPLGSLGDLAETGVGLTANLILGWGPSAAMPEADGVAVYVQLPALVGGLAGFDLQGYLKTTFGDANLARVIYQPKPTDPERGVYVLLFNNVAISIFGIALPPKVVTDFILFSDPTAPGGSDIAWSLAATQVEAS